MSCPVNFRPVYPQPLTSRAGLLKILFRKRRSWLDGLYERSYGMKMGEVRLPGLHLFMVNQPDLVRRVMVDEVKDFPKHEILGEILEPVLGESIFTTNGRQWRKQRDMLDPSFANARVQHVFGLMRAAAAEMEQRLDARGTEPFDIDEEMTYVTADIIFRTILSVSIEEGDARKIFDAFVIFQQESPKTALRKAFHMDWLPFSRAKKLRHETGKEIRAALERVIRPRYDAGPGDEKDILSSILSTVDEDTQQRFTFEEIVDQVAMLFLAGHETSAAALTWSCYLLATHPEIQEQAHAEVERVLSTGPLDVSAVRDMELVRDVFRESLRLYPPVGFSRGSAPPIK